MPLHIHTLGALRLRWDTQPHLLTGNAAALIGYLTLQHHTNFTLTRSRAAGTIWPLVDEDRARHLLSNALYRLQKQHPRLTDHFVLTAETIALKNIWVDALVFTQQANTAAPHAWQAALDLYQGDFLEELDAEWANAPRALLCEQYLATLQRTCTHLEQTSTTHLHKALLLAQRWVHADPLNEQAHVTLMRLYAKLGRTAAAQKQYQTLVKLFKEELQLTPSPETIALSRTLQPITTPPSPTTLFVGRQTERTQLIHHIEQLKKHGRGGVILITGEPGIGKTALLAEAQHAANWHNITHAGGRTTAEYEERGAPLTPALNALSRQPLLHATITQLTPLMRQIILPLLGQKPSHHATAAPNPSPKSHFVPQLSPTAALRYLLQTWLAQTPLLLILDDVHWADAQFWEYLPLLADLAQHHPLLLLLAYRPWEQQHNAPAQAALDQLLRTHQPHHLPLIGLDNSAIQRLAEAYGNPQRASHAQKLSGGNPLLLHEILHNRTEAPPKLSSLLHQRLDALSSADREALSAAAMLGQEIDFVHWCALLQRSLSTADLARLVHSRFIRETAVAHTFQHDLVRLHLYQQIPTPRRHAWHQQLADLLTHTAASPARAAWHYAQAQAWLPALRAYHRAAHHALALYAYPTARQHTTNATNIIAQTSGAMSPRDTLPTRVLAFQLDHLTQPSGDDLPRLETLAAEAQTHADEESHLRLLLIKYDMLAGHTTADELATLRQQLLDLVEGVGRTALAQQAYQQIAIQTTFTQGDFTAGLPFAKRAERLATMTPNNTTPSPHRIAEAKLTVAACLLRGRQTKPALAQLQQVETLLAENEQLQQLQTEWLYLWGVAAQFTGDWDLSHQIYEKAVQTHRHNGHFSGLMGALYNLANSCIVRGQAHQAILYATEMVELAEAQLGPTETDKRLRYRTMLVDGYVLAEAYAEAWQALEPLRPWLDKGGEGSTAVRAWRTIGSIHFGEKAYQAAHQAYRRAFDLATTRQSITASSFLSLAEVCALLGETYHEEGRTALAEAQARLRPDQTVSTSATYYHYVCYLYSHNPADIAHAYELMMAQAAQFGETAVQHSFIHQHPVHRDILTAREAHLPAPLMVELVRRDVPLGRPTTPADLVPVRWTVDDGAGDAAVLATQGKTAVRRHRLVRLMREAQAQNAAPTYADLSAVLGVSERTIARDVQALAQAGQPVHTRRHGRS